MPDICKNRQIQLTAFVRHGPIPGGGRPAAAWLLEQAHERSVLCRSFDSSNGGWTIIYHRTPESADDVFSCCKMVKVEI